MLHNFQRRKTLLALVISILTICLAVTAFAAPSAVEMIDYAKEEKTEESQQNATLSAEIWDGSIASGFESGSGTDTDPYIIKTPQQLAYLAASVNSGTTYDGKFIKLANDIYLNDTTNWENWGTTKPANSWTAINEFRGTFDGGGYKIVGIYINSTSNYQGLFGYTYYGITVKNLGIVNSYIKGNDYVGGLIGQDIYSSFSDCYYEGIIVGENSVGGFIGETSNSEIVNCYSDVIISAVTGIGGFAGGNASEITNCYAKTNILTGYYTIGGFVGANTGDITHCYASGNVISEEDSENIGGFVGSHSGEIIESFSEVNVTGSNYIGGFVGTNEYSVHGITDCYAVGTVKAIGSYAESVGGFVGWNYSGKNVNCYSLGTVIIESNSSSYVGAFVGEFYSGTAINCYYNNENTRYSDTKAKGLSSSEMKSAESYSGFEFGTVWAIDGVKNNGYPYLITPLDESTSSSCGTNLTWTLDENGTLTISGTGEMTNFSNFSSVPWYNDITKIKNVILGSGVTSIGNYSFYGCENLSNISIPDTLSTIGNYSFYGCENLSNISIPNTLSSIGDYAFYGCENLSNISIPDTLSTIGNYAFYGCLNLATIVVPDSVTSIGNYAFCSCIYTTTVSIGNNVESIGDNAFEHCLSLRDVYIGNNVKSIGYMAFSRCQSLTSMNLPNSVESIGEYAFNECESLKNVVIGNSLRNISDRAFYCCRELTSINIPNSVESIGYYSFRDCSSLTSISIPDSVKFIDLYAFSNCKSLKSVDIGNSVESIGYMAFSNCESLTSINIPDSITHIEDLAFNGCKKLLINVSDGNKTYSSIDGVLLNKNKTKIIRYAKDSVCPEYRISDSVTSIGAYSFEHCSDLTTLFIPASVNSIEWNAFYYCDGLQTVYYSGSEEQWNRISIKDYNDSLLNANIIYNHVVSENTPTTLLNVHAIRTISPAGLRFQAEIPTAHTATEIGWIVTTESKLTSAGISKDDFTKTSDVTKVEGINYSEATGTDKVFSTDGENDIFAAVLTGITSKDYQTVLVARPYAIDEDGTWYGEPYSMCIRDVAEIMKNSSDFNSFTEQQQAVINAILAGQEI